MNRQRWFWFAVLAVGLTGLVLYLVDRFPGALGDSPSQARFVHLLLLLVFVGSSLVLRRRTRRGSALRNAAIWAGVGLALVIAYSYRDLLPDLMHRLGGELLPQQGMAVGTDGVSFRATLDGQFQVEAMVDGVRILFLVDTGASDVVLSPDDARRLGFDPDRLAFTRIYQTANGTVPGAPVRLGEIVIGPIRVADVRASVNGAPLDRSLLGMSFLSRLGGYEVRGDTLTLRR